MDNKGNSHLWWDGSQRWKSQQQFSKSCRLIGILSPTVFLESALWLFLKWLNVWHIGETTSIWDMGRKREENVRIELFGSSGGERFQNCLGTFFPSFLHQSRKSCQNHFFTFHLESIHISQKYTCVHKCGHVVVGCWIDVCVGLIDVKWKWKIVN